MKEEKKSVAKKVSPKKLEYLCMFVTEIEEEALADVLSGGGKYIEPNYHIQKAFMPHVAANEFAEAIWLDKYREDDSPMWEGEKSIKVRLLSGGDWTYYKVHKFMHPNFLSIEIEAPTKQ